MAATVALAGHFLRTVPKRAFPSRKDLKKKN